jgi:hypothetical protein
MVKMRQDGKVENRAVYIAIGINMEDEGTVTLRLEARFGMPVFIDDHNAEKRSM